MHVAHDPRRGLGSCARKEGIAGREGSVCICREQRAVVVQHLFEVRNHPVLIDRVARKTAAHVVVDATFAHPPQGERSHVQRLLIRLCVVRARAPVAQQPFDRLRVREFRRAAEATVATVESPCQQFPAALDGCGRELQIARGSRRIEIHERRHERIVLRAQFAFVLAIIPGDSLQQILECRQPVTRLLRKIRPSEERPVIVMCQKHRQRPPARALCQHLLRDLIDAIDVRPLFAVDFDVDK